MPPMFAPFTGFYAVIRIDPVGSTEGMDYSDIQEAARNMRTRRHLVYLKLVSSHTLTVPASTTEPSTLHN